MNSNRLCVESLRVHLNGREILRGISFEIKRGEQWTIFGTAGSGKTVLAHTLAGDHAFQGRIDFASSADDSGTGVIVVDQQHRFRDLQNQANFYYQQRYNAMDADATKTVAEDLSVFAENANGIFSKKQLIDTFHLDGLLNEPLIQLSNGENKRIQILKAVLGAPHLLILDEPYTGLDIEGRLMLDRILQSLSDSGQWLLLFSSRDHTASCFNRFAILQDGTLRTLEKAEHVKKILTVKPEKYPEAPKEFPSSIGFTYPDFHYAVRMTNVHICYDGKYILKDINWEVRKSSCWALTGHNGAGKTTLLSLITADNPQAYANEIYLFDRKRGSGESIWEIKQKIGFLSPELHLYFDSAATAFTALASGLFDTIGLFRKLNEQQEQLVMEWLEFLGCGSYAQQLLTRLPAGIQRLILLGRAMIKTPPLLILDEPCQGLDRRQTALALEIIDRYCSRFGSSLIFVSHYPDDFPACIRQTLTLSAGRII
jgi:molybdate transport system ATP-binding protein